MVALALGVGATTAVFTLLDRVVLRPLPYPDADRLVMTWETNDGKGLAHERLSPVNFMDYRGLSQAFDDAAALVVSAADADRDGAGSASRECHRGEREFLLRARRAAGARPGFPERAVLLARSDRGHQSPLVARAVRRRPGDRRQDDRAQRSAVHRGRRDAARVSVSRRHRRVASVDLGSTQHSRGAHFMESLVQAEARRHDRSGQRGTPRADEAARPGESVDQWRVERAGGAARDEVVGFFRPALFALFGAAAFLLVITCTNVASLLLARATVREREVAVRAAIGASRGRLVRQFLTESVLLALMGTTLGVVVAVGVVARSSPRRRWRCRG